MHNHIPDNHLYIHANIDTYTINLRLKNDVIVNIHIHIVTKPIKSNDLAQLIYPVAYCIQDIHDIIRQQYPAAEYNLILKFNYSQENLLSSEGWLISATSATPAIVTQHFIRQRRNENRYQLRYLTTPPAITPTTTFATNIEENTALLDAYYHFLKIHPNTIWYESKIYHNVLFPHLSNAELDVIFSYSDKNILIHTVKLHTYDYSMTIKPNMGEQAINNIINNIPITENISHHQYIALIRWLRQLPSIYDEQIAPLVADATTLFHTYYALPTPTN